MSFQGQPILTGTYRVEQYNSNGPGYWNYISDGSSSIQLDSLEESSDLFKVHCFYHPWPANPDISVEHCPRIQWRLERFHHQTCIRHECWFLLVTKVASCDG
jgi:hypothetical protein